MSRAAPVVGSLCPERMKLSYVVIEAIDAVYAAKNEAEKEKARETERIAIAALQAHRKEHGC